MDSQTQSPMLVDLQIKQPEQTLFKKAASVLAVAKSYTIDSADMRDLAAQELMKIKGLQNDVETQRTSITQPMNVALRAVNALFKGPADFLGQAEALLKTAISNFDREQERLRLIEQAQREEEARKERARLDAEAASAAATAEAEAQEIQRKAEQAAAAGDVATAARLNEEAAQRIEQGAAEVETMQQTATLITAPVVAAPRKTSGVSTRKQWKAEITDKLALIRYVAEHPEYVDLLDANMPAINKIALALKANCPLKGVRVFEDSVIAARAA